MLLAWLWPWFEQPLGPAFVEASGIIQDGDSLVITGDDADGFYFVCSGEALANVETAITPSLLKVFELADCPATAIGSADEARDLESVALLADGSHVVLSEDRRFLIRVNGLGITPTGGNPPWGPPGVVVARYPKAYREVGGRGLEGLAIRQRDAAGGYQIAVLWEGGYPGRAEKARRPRLLIHRSELTPVAQEVGHPLSEFELDVAVSGQEEPAGQRFRATDLVWRDPDGSGAGFIVLMGSHEGAGRNVYGWSAWTCR